MGYKEFFDQYNYFLEHYSNKIDLNSLHWSYENRDTISDCRSWANFPQFMNYMSLIKNPVPPIGYHLSQTDPSGYVDKERFICWLPECYGGDGEYYFGTTAAEAIYKAVEENNKDNQ